MKRKIFFVRSGLHAMAWLAVLVPVAGFCADEYPINIKSDPLIQSIIKDTEEIVMAKGELTTIDVKDLQRVSVGNPEVADIVNAEGEDLVIIGKSDGKTPIFIWDAAGKRMVNVHVLSESLVDLKRRIEQLLAAADLDRVNVGLNAEERQVVLTGVVPENKMEKFEKITEPFEDSGQAMILVNEGRNEDLVQVDLEIMEVSSTLLRNLGIDWYSGSVSGDPFSISLVESLPTYNERSDLFNIGRFGRSQVLLARINAMVEEGNARTLSRPKLVVVSGEEASFLVGGEVPIRTTTVSASGSSTENVEFKEYGVAMTITPTVKEEKIDIILNLDITDIDRANATEQDLAFLVRSAQTRLQLDDGETIILAGLIRTIDNEVRRRIPYLGKIPVLGLLFRSSRTPAANEDTELVVSLTPHIIVDQLAKDAKRISRVSYQPVAESAPAPAPPVSTDMNAYIQSIQQAIVHSVVYPEEAAELGWEGTVKLNMMILSDGTLAFAVVEESSGHDMIDRSALNLVRVLNYPPFPATTSLKDINITVPIVYQSH